MESIGRPSAEILALPLHVRAEMALQDVIASHIRSGRPIHIWRDGGVVEVAGEELIKLSKQE